jgi:hypothetical protein
MRKPTAGRAVSLLAALPLAAMAQPPKPATGTLTITFAAEATMMNPQRSAAGVDQCSIGQMFEQLVRTGPDLKKRGWPAESRQVKEENGNPYVDVHLRKGVEFHNGDPLRTGRTPWPGQPQRDRLRRPPRPRSAARGCTPERLRCALLQPDHAARAVPEGGGEAYFAPATAVDIRCKTQEQEHNT